MSVPQQSKSLAEHDPELFGILKNEEERQFGGLELIASENLTSRAVMEACGSCFTNKYSEGLPGSRYYGGTQCIDDLERLTQKRALEAFRLNSEEWGVNVQPYSGSIANFAAFTALLKPHDRVMGLNLPSGGHLSHGYYRSTKSGFKPVNASAIYFESLPYDLDAATGLVDYNELAKQALIYCPKLIVAGGSAYPREWNYAKFREVADSVGAYLMVDMAHYAGLVASEVLQSPFDTADIVTTTTHKSLRGPRAALIFYRKSLEKQVNFAVFPTTQGGPHNHAIAGVCTQLKEVQSEHFREYSRQVVTNCKRLIVELEAKGYKMATGGTDNHLLLWDLRPEGLSGGKMEALCDAAAITLNKNSVHGDKSAFSPGGVRIGTPALTSRGFKEQDMVKVAEFLHRAVVLAKQIQESAESRKLADFRKALAGNADAKKLKDEVEAYSKTFYMPGGFIGEHKK